MTRAISSGDLRGGEYVTGISVTPNNRAAVKGGKTAFINGGPLGSSATIALIFDGLASPRTQPWGPDCECVSRITGYAAEYLDKAKSAKIIQTPIMSRSWVTAAFNLVTVSISEFKLGTVEAKKLLKMGSPTLPLPGHCV